MGQKAPPSPLPPPHATCAVRGCVVLLRSSRWLLDRREIPDSSISCAPGPSSIRMRLRASAWMFIVANRCGGSRCVANQRKRSLLSSDHNDRESRCPSALTSRAHVSSGSEDIGNLNRVYVALEMLRVRSEARRWSFAWREQGIYAGERRGKMQFETLRQFCSSVLSHFNGAFTSPQNILQTELLEQALGSIGWVRNASEVTRFAFLQEIVRGGTSLTVLGERMKHLYLGQT